MANPGPNLATTITAEEVQKAFISAKDEEPTEVDDLKKKLLNTQKGQVKCRLCNEDHWTKQCHYRNKLEPFGSSRLGDEKEEDLASVPTPDKKAGSSKPKKCVPSSRKKGGSKNLDETASLRVKNLSEKTMHQDVINLFRPFGDIRRIFLGKDEVTHVCKGFGFINYKRRDDAAKAISVLNGFEHDNLILNVEWAKSKTNQKAFISAKDEEKVEDLASVPTPDKKAGSSKPKKCVHSSRKKGGSKNLGESMMSKSQGPRDETASVRVTNLSEKTMHQDVMDLFRPFGDIRRIFLGKDKVTHVCKGFGFINYKRRDDAAKAISVLNGFEHDNLILNVEWAKSKTNQKAFISAKDEEPTEVDDLIKELIDAEIGQVKCSLCNEDHWTKQCHYRNKLEPLGSSVLEDEKEDKKAGSSKQPKKDVHFSRKKAKNESEGDVMKYKIFIIPST